MTTLRRWPTVLLLLAWFAWLGPTHTHRAGDAADHAEPRAQAPSHDHADHTGDPSSHDDRHDCQTCWLIHTLTPPTPPLELALLAPADVLPPPRLAPQSGVAWILHQRGRGPPSLA